MDSLPKIIECHKEEEAVVNYNLPQNYGRVKSVSRKWAVLSNTAVVLVILLVAGGVVVKANLFGPGKATFGALGRDKLRTRRKPAVPS